MDSFCLFFSLEVGLCCLLFEYLFLFFHLKEILRTCQVYRFKVIAEPGGKDLCIALVMCCSDNFSFQSKINYCFITRMPLGLHFIHLHKKTIHNSQEELKKNRTKWSCPLTRGPLTSVTCSLPSLITFESFHHFILGLKGDVFFFFFYHLQLKRIRLAATDLTPMLRKDLCAEPKAWELREERIKVTKPEGK